MALSDNVWIKSSGLSNPKLPPNYVTQSAKYLRAGLKNGASDAGLKQIIKDTNTMTPWQYARNYQTVGKPLDLYAKAVKYSAGEALDAVKATAYSARNTVGDLARMNNLGMKTVAKTALGRAAPWVGAALGANELRKNVPELVRGIPAYMQERKAAKQSEANLSKLTAELDKQRKAKAASKLPNALKGPTYIPTVEEAKANSTFADTAPKAGEDVYAREARLYGLKANQ
jgi:hypothetical protein